MNVHLVDGTYELFRAYYGAPSSLAPDGREVGATRALGRSLLALLSDRSVTHVAVAFDHVIESFRNDLFDGYKTGEGIEPLLWAQFGLAEEITAALGVIVWPMVEFEADDALAAGAAQYAAFEEVSHIVLCSPDKDLAQCVSGTRVVCWDRMRNKRMDEAGVHVKFGVGPGSIPDYLALVGDTADGIPGVPRWGAKSAGAVLAEYQHLDEIPSDAKRWSVKVRGAQALSDNLNAMRTEAALYKRLATLRRDVPLGESLGDLAWRGPSRELAELARRLGDDDLVARAERVFAMRT